MNAQKRAVEKQKDAETAKRYRAERDAAALAGARADAERRADAEAEAARAAERRAAMLEATLGRIDAEKARQAAAARTRARRKHNASRTRERAAARMQRLRDELEAERERAALIDTRKSAAARSHHTMGGIIAQLGIRDAGRLASGRVGAVVKAFDAYRSDGKSFNLRPASRSTIDRWLWKGYLAGLILENKEISELLATGKVGVQTSADMSSMLGSELLVSDICLGGSSVLDELDFDGYPKLKTFLHKYENPVLAVEGKTGKDLAWVLAQIWKLRGLVPPDTEVWSRGRAGGRLQRTARDASILEIPNDR